MPANVLVIVVDGLRASALGAYGNTSFATPALDRFAAESLLLDWCFAPSPELTGVYRALWHSIHPAQPDFQPPVSLAQLFADRGYATTFVTDEALLSSPASDAGYSEIVQLAGPRESSEVARSSDPSDTELARVFAAASGALENASPDKPQLYWLHARGMYGVWDAPVEFQQSLLDEGDPPPVEPSITPDLLIERDDDPDAAFRYASAYAAQVMVLDECLETLLGVTNATTAPWLIMLLGARGFPLGEHGRIGGVDPRLYAEGLQVPWLVRFPDNRGRLARSGRLTCHLDVLPTLAEWLGDRVKFDESSLGGASVLPLASASPTAWRDAVVSTSVTASAIRTAAWSLRSDRVANNDGHSANNATSPLPELYVRPDDRWEANNIAKLCPEVVEELHAHVAGLFEAGHRR